MPVNALHVKRGEIWMSLITCGSIHQGHEWFSDDSRGRRDFFCLAVLLCEQLCRFANGGAKTSIKSYFMRSFFCLSVFSRKKREETVKATCFSPGVGTPIYGLYRYVPRNRVWFLRFSVLK